MAGDELDFNGFHEEATQFLRELAANNDRTWFNDNKERYQTHLLEPARAFVTAMGEKLETVVPGIHAEPRVNGSIFRINRDTRFSKDKTPYKTHLDMWFWSGDGRGWDNPGFFFRMTADALILGAGIHKFGPQTLAAYRESVVDPAIGRSLEQAIRELSSNGPYVLGGEHYKRVPRGYDPDHERSALLRHAGLFAELEGAVPSNAYTRKFPEYCFAHYRNLLPLFRWLGKLVNPGGGHR